MVTLDGSDDRTCVNQRTGQAAGTGANLEHRLSFEGAGHTRDTIKQLRVEQEVLAKCF